MSTTLSSLVPFAIYIKNICFEDRQKIFDYLVDNVKRTNPEEDERPHYLDTMDYVGICETDDGSSFIYFEDHPKYFGSKSVNTLTAGDVMKHINNQPSKISKKGNIEMNKNTQTTEIILNAILKELPTDIYHFRIGKGKTVSNTGGMTVITKLVGNKLLIGAAVCSRNDNFNRKEGIKYASDRFEIIPGEFSKLPAKHEVINIMLKSQCRNTVKMARDYKRQL